MQRGSPLINGIRMKSNDDPCDWTQRFSSIWTSTYLGNEKLQNHWGSFGSLWSSFRPLRLSQTSLRHIQSHPRTCKPPFKPLFKSSKIPYEGVVIHFFYHLIIHCILKDNHTLYTLYVSMCSSMHEYTSLRRVTIFIAGNWFAIWRQKSVWVQKMRM